MVNLEWYRTFKAIYQYGTLTRAAQELMISQPNMSIQLASLESYIGRPLFVRLPRKMMPTEYGKQLYSQIVESIDNLERVEAEFKRAALNKVPAIRLGTPSEIFLNYLAEHLGSQSDMQMAIEYGLANELTNKIISNELDMAIITKQNKTESVLTYEPLFDESFMVVCNPSTDCSGLEKLLRSENMPDVEKWLKEKKWYAYSNDLTLIKRFWRENFKKRPMLKIHAVVPDNNAILQAVANSDGLAVTSDLIASKAIVENKVKVLWKGINPSSNTLYLAYNKDKILPLYLEKMKIFIKTYIKYN